MTRLCFADLESMSGIDYNEDSSALGKWYQAIRTTPVDQLSDGDLARACRQRLFLEYVVPAGLLTVKHNPLAGDQYDCELVVSIVGVPWSWWQENEGAALYAQEIMQEVLDALDDDVKDNVFDFLNKFRLDD